MLISFFTPNLKSYNMKVEITLMSKLKPIRNIIEICQIQKAKGKTAGLITGCFDIIHVGHIRLFKFAKSKCDVVIVGLENDETIKITKAKRQPFFNLSSRAELLSELKSVDHIFEIKQTYNFKSNTANLIHKNIYRSITPTFLITNPH